MLTAMALFDYHPSLECASLTCGNEKMTVGDPLILYTRAHCHLCELAVAMLETAGVEWQAVDIDDDAELTERYGLQVPVLSHPVSGQELFYPFDQERLQNYLDSGS
jgi:hypothetical protein